MHSVFQVKISCYFLPQHLYFIYIKLLLAYEFLCSQKQKSMLQLYYINRYYFWMGLKNGAPIVIRTLNFELQSVSLWPLLNSLKKMKIRSSDIWQNLFFFSSFRYVNKLILPFQWIPSGLADYLSQLLHTTIRALSFLQTRFLHLYICSY